MTKTRWKPGDQCQWRDGKNWVDAEIVQIVPGSLFMPIRVRTEKEWLLRYSDFDNIRPRPRGPRLTPAEQRIVDLARDHVLVTEMPAKLGVTINTVKKQVRSILRKVGAPNLRRALARGLL